MLSAISVERCPRSRGIRSFCFVRKPWREIPLHYRNTLVVCALNPFHTPTEVRTTAILEQLDEDDRSAFLELPRFGFDGRLLRIAQRALKDCLTNEVGSELGTPDWSEMVRSPREVVFTHNFGFHPTGILREAYTSYLNERYALEALSGHREDLSMLKVNEITSWLGAWQFMEMCGFQPDEFDEDDDVPMELPMA